MKWKRETKKIIKDKETEKGEIRKRNRGNEKERQRRLERETGKTRNGDKYIIRKRDKERGRDRGNEIEGHGKEVRFLSKPNFFYKAKQDREKEIQGNEKDRQGKPERKT